MAVWCCVASGPSLTPEDVDALRGRVRVLVVNDGYRLAPWADALYAADMSWWQVHGRAAAVDFAGRMYSIQIGAPKRPDPVAVQYELKLFSEDRPLAPKPAAGVGLSRTPGRIRLGGLSGFQAINIAYLWGAKVILLLGYDMQAGAGGRLHWFGDHPRPLTNGDGYSKRLKTFASIVPAEYGIEIINCSRATALTCFPRLPLAEALDRYALACAA